MRILNFNIRFGGQKRTSEIINYLFDNDFDLIILTEFIKNDNGNTIIDNLNNQGYYTQVSNEDGGYGSFIASKNEFVIKSVENRWAEVYIPKLDLYVLGVYVPDQPGRTKDSFWKNILDYAAKHKGVQVLITGDFNSCTPDDSFNGTEYYAKELKQLEDLDYTDLWKSYSNDESNRYTWFYHSGEGFRLDYAFVSSKLSESFGNIRVCHDFKIREINVSDHSSLRINWK